jgi:hypothetical protein
LQFYHRGEFLIVDESARAHLEIVRASKGGRAGVAPGGRDVGARGASEES